MKNPVRQLSAARNYFLVLVIVLMSQHASSKIRNGYDNDIAAMRESLKNLVAILHEPGLSASQRKNIESKVAVIKSNLSYYELTEDLLSHFKVVAPTMYNEIDGVTDKKGRPVDVYVKFIPRASTDLFAWGTTYIGQSETDEDTYRSEYGELTVSVKIWIVSKALLVLSHELGHVKYQVPNLASYVAFHKKNYASAVDRYDYIGHAASDPSGDSADEFEKRFHKEYAQYLRTTREKIRDPLVIMDKIRRNLNNI